mgnify:CR=1 FL=1
MRRLGMMVVVFNDGSDNDLRSKRLVIQRV